MPKDASRRPVFPVDLSEIFEPETDPRLFATTSDRQSQAIVYAYLRGYAPYKCDILCDVPDGTFEILLDRGEGPPIVLWDNGVRTIRAISLIQFQAKLERDPVAAKAFIDAAAEAEAKPRKRKSRRAA